MDVKPLKGERADVAGRIAAAQGARLGLAVWRIANGAQKRRANRRVKHGRQRPVGSPAKAAAGRQCDRRGLDDFLGPFLTTTLIRKASD